MGLIASGVMLETFVQNRGGLEGAAAEFTTSGMDQGSFELFFQQIRRFLTVQEQVDLYDRKYKLTRSLREGFSMSFLTQLEPSSCTMLSNVLLDYFVSKREKRGGKKMRL